MSRSPKLPELQPKKLPVQARSRATFEAIVEACAWLLIERGYAATTTNHIAEWAGVNIASVYEYFPGKDAVVAQVAERLVERVLRRLAEGVARVMQREDDEAMRAWIELVYETVACERDLVAVFTYEVPYTQQLDSVRDSRERLLSFSRQLRDAAARVGFVQPSFSEASLHLVINLVTSTILQLVLTPPDDLPHQALLDALIQQVDAWIRGSRPAG